MNTKLLTIDDIKQIISELTLTKTDRVTKISEGSVFSGIMYGIAKISQKAIKDIAIVESHVYPEYAYGEYLDDIVARLGIQPRLTSSGSSTWVRVVGEPGTEYYSGLNRCYDVQGLTFDFEESFIIPPIGYTYQKIRSVEVGRRTNSDPYTVNRVSPQPDGHFYITNEFAAQYGRDSESDEMLRVRIKNSLNELSSKTLSYLEQVLIKFNSNVLRIVRGGTESGKLRLVVLSQNGIDFTPGEFEFMLDGLKDYLSITDLQSFGSDQVGVTLHNPTWKYIDIDFRCQLDSSADPFNVRIDIQSQLSKIIDFRSWDYGMNIEWDDIFSVVKSTKGVRYVPDNFFDPRVDTLVGISEFPRFRGFIMRDMNGVIISDSQNQINPAYFPNKVSNTIQGAL